MTAIPTSFDVALDDALDHIDGAAKGAYGSGHWGHAARQSLPGGSLPADAASLFRGAPRRFVAVTRPRHAKPSPFRSNPPELAEAVEEKAEDADLVDRAVGLVRGPWERASAGVSTAGEAQAAWARVYDAHEPALLRVVGEASERAFAGARDPEASEELAAIGATWLKSYGRTLIDRVIVPRLEGRDVKARAEVLASVPQQIAPAWGVGFGLHRPEGQ